MTRLGMDIQKRLDDAKANYQRIESQLKNKRLEIEQLERILLIAQLTVFLIAIYYTFFI